MSEAVKPDGIVFLRGKKTILRPLDKEKDLENCVRWLNDPEIRHFISIFLPLSRGQEKKLLEKKDEANDKNMILAIDTLEGEHIGNMGIHRIEWKDRTASTGTVIGNPAYWGRGYGTDAKMSLLYYMFDTLNLRKICSKAIAFNERSVRYSLRCGYQEEGRLKEHFFKDGKYWDMVLLAVFRQQWWPIWEKYQKTGTVR